MYTEIKYLNLLSPRLDKFKRKKDSLWNFRCPLCGDSHKNKNKARGFVFAIKGDLVYKCHNCGVGMSLPHLIEHMDPRLYKEYKLEKFKENNTSTIDYKKLEKKVTGSPVFKTNILSGLQKVDDLNNSHPAKEYLLNRKLPTDSLYYTDQFQHYTNSVNPGTFEDTSKDEPRIIIPLTSSDGTTFGYQGRAIGPSKLRYITIIHNNEYPKIFGLDRVDPNKTIYITEGPFDSLLLDNGIAMAGSDGRFDFISGDNLVFVFDNEPRNKEITDRMAKVIDRGQYIVIWPEIVHDKDLNDLWLSGKMVNMDELTIFCENNTFSGLTAKLKFNSWKK